MYFENFNQKNFVHCIYYALLSVSLVFIVLFFYDLFTNNSNEIIYLWITLFIFVFAVIFYMIILLLNRELPKNKWFN